MEEKGLSSSDRMVEVLEELLTVLRGNDAKLAKRKDIQQSHLDEGQDEPFRWYQHSLPTFDFSSMSTLGKHISVLTCALRSPCSLHTAPR